MSDLISRQAAIDALEQIFDRCEEIEAHLPESDPDRTGYKMYPDYITVWSYLHQLPSAQPDLDEWCTDCREYDHENLCCPRFNRVIRETVEEVKEAHEEMSGRWIDATKEIGWPEWKCSVCGGNGRGDYLVCPWCGAKMDEVEKNDDRML